MNHLLIDIHDESFSCSSSALGSKASAARMFDLSIFARNGFLNDNDIVASKGANYQSPVEPYGNKNVPN